MEDDEAMAGHIAQWADSPCDSERVNYDGAIVCLTGLQRANPDARIRNHGNTLVRAHDTARALGMADELVGDICNEVLAHVSGDLFSFALFKATMLKLPFDKGLTTRLLRETYAKLAGRDEEHSRAEMKEWQATSLVGTTRGQSSMCAAVETVSILGGREVEGGYFLLEVGGHSSLWLLLREKSRFCGYALKLRPSHGDTQAVDLAIAREYFKFSLKVVEALTLSPWLVY